MVRQINEQAVVKNRLSLLILVSLLLLVPLSSAITAKQSNWTPEPEATWINEVDFTATGINTSLNFTQSAMLEIPTNHTVTSTQATISPMWDKIYPSESRFGHNQTLGWSGNLNNVEVSSNSNQLRLQANSSSITILILRQAQSFQVTVGLLMAKMMKFGQLLAIIRHYHQILACPYL